MSVALGSCTSAATGIEVEIRRLPSIVQTGGMQPDGILAAVDRFKDRRDERGLRDQEPRLWKQNVLFTAGDGDIGDLTAEAFAIYLRHKLGWRAWVGKATAAQPEGGADARISGRIMELGATLSNYGAITTVCVKVEFQVDVMSRSDVEPLSITLSASKSAWFFRTTSDRVERLLSLTLIDAFDQFDKQTEVIGNLVRLTVTPSQPKADAPPPSTAR